MRHVSSSLRKAWCSTPFGITDYFGPRCRWQTVCALPGAQRLSASRIISGLTAVPSRSRRARCSTPFGITDYFGRATPRVVVHAVAVLNAFRHHGLFRLRLHDTRLVHARVLNAFRHHGLFRRQTHQQILAQVHVLNAFRHHGLFRCRWRSAAPRRQTGAQRLSASRIISAADSPTDPCSGPCAQRLSASRIISVSMAERSAS